MGYKYYTIDITYVLEYHCNSKFHGCRDDIIGNDKKYTQILYEVGGIFVSIIGDLNRIRKVSATYTIIQMTCSNNIE